MYEHLVFHMTHSQMFQKVEYGLPAKIWQLLGYTEMISWQDQVNNADSAIILLINHWSVKVVGLVRVVEVVQVVQIVQVVKVVQVVQVNHGPQGVKG